VIISKERTGGGVLKACEETNTWGQVETGGSKDSARFPKKMEKGGFGNYEKRRKKVKMWKIPMCIPAAGTLGKIYQKGRGRLDS